MNSSNALSPFTEHSLRRLKLLIHQQDALDGRDSRAKTTLDQQGSPSSKTFELADQNAEEQARLFDDPTIDSNSDQLSSTRQRAFMRPPKTRSISRCCPSGLLEKSFDRSSSSNVVVDRVQRLNQERNLYEQRIEINCRNDLREKYNIPPPFERQWLRQPRYVPQERPQFGQMKPMND